MVPLNRREGASEGLGDLGRPVSQVLARSPGRFAVQAVAEAPLTGTSPPSPFRGCRLRKCCAGGRRPTSGWGDLPLVGVEVARWAPEEVHGDDDDDDDDDGAAADNADDGGVVVQPGGPPITWAQVGALGSLGLVGNLRPRPFRGSGLGPPAPRPLAVKLHYLAVESRSCCCEGTAELSGSLGVDLPVIRVRVWEPLRSLRWQPVWGDRPASGVRVMVPLNRREGASEGLGDLGRPVSQVLARSPGRFAVQAVAEAPVSRGAQPPLWPLLCMPSQFAQGARLRALLQPRPELCCASLCS
ncbi:uncharacterized protein LOC115616229 [Strigops habroptila]|uniref:uncharacterized protein LOC115616229 n=1 Tax=Strigops habroptila TaxID=2489341 RepID=UPI0011CEEF21|nr:uncharacterized protein LOC115616229 [Strigops habroptila]